MNIDTNPISENKGKAPVVSNTEEKKEWMLLPFRARTLSTGVLLVNDYYEWILVTHTEYQEILKQQVFTNKKLFQKLLAAHFFIPSTILPTYPVLNREQSKLRGILSGPSLHIIILTKRCNQKCVYCHALACDTCNPEKYDLTQELAQKYVDLIFTSPNTHITIEFQGGEPLLNLPVLQFITEYAQQKNKNLPENKQKNLKLCLVTNLELMTEEIFEYLNSHEVSICTSLDGPDYLHDKNRPSYQLSSSHANAVYWIKRIKKEGVFVGALATTSKESLKYPTEIIDEYRKMGFFLIHLRELNFLGKAIGNWQDIGYDADEFIEFWKKGMEYIIELNKKGEFFAERGTIIKLEKILQKKNPGYLDLMNPCGAAIGQMAYNYDGNIYTCDEARTLAADIFKIGTSEDKSIPKILTTDKTLQIITTAINDEYSCIRCAYKPYCGVCPVCNYRESGTIISNIQTSRHCKVLKAQFDYIFEKLADTKCQEIFNTWITRKDL